MSSLNITLALLAAEVIVFVFCLIQDRKPINPAKPKLLPYRLIMLTLIVIFLATLAHLVGMLTGQEIKPRSKMGM